MGFRRVSGNFFTCLLVVIIFGASVLSTSPVDARPSESGLEGVEPTLVGHDSTGAMWSTDRHEGFAHGSPNLPAPEVSPAANGLVTITANEVGLLNIACPFGFLEISGGTPAPAGTTCADTDLVINADNGSAEIRFDDATTKSVRVEGDVDEQAALVILGSLETETFTVGGGAIVLSGWIRADTVAIVASTSIAIVEGSRISAPGGQILLDAGEVGFVQQHGSSIDVSSPLGSGGELVVTGANVSVAGTMASSGRGGSISLLSGTDAGLTLISGEITADARSFPGGRGGDIRILGNSVALIGPSEIGNGAQISADGTTGGGSILIGGDRAGSGPIPTSQETVVDDEVLITADATHDGPGGSIVVWSDGSTTYRADANAVGAGSGPGGFIEVSGKETLDNEGSADVSGPGGDGELLLDPLFFTVVPAGILSPLTAIDDADAVATKASPALAAQGTELIGNLFCDLIGLSGCGPISHPQLDSYTVTYGAKNDLVKELAKIPQLRKIKPRAWFSFISTPTLEQFTGDITGQGIFGVQILPDAPSTLGLSASDDGLDLVNQGPGEEVKFETFFSVVTMGRISLGGADLTLQAGDQAPAAEIDALVADITEGSPINVNDLRNLSFEDIVSDGIADSLSRGGSNEETLVDLIELVDLLSGGRVPPGVEHLPGVLATPVGLSNLAAAIRMIDALGAPVPDWMHDIADVIDEIDDYLDYLPNATDLFDLALGGVTIPPIPGIPGVITPEFCIVVEIDGVCWATPPIPGIPGAETFNIFTGEYLCNLGLGFFQGGHCWTTPPIPGTPGEVVPESCLGFVQDGECWTTPPIPTFRIPGVCDIDPANIPCSTDELIVRGLLPVIELALENTLPDNFNDLVGSVPDALKIPSLSAASRGLPAILYADSQISSPGGTINLVNSARGGSTLLGDVVTGSTVIALATSAASAAVPLGTPSTPSTPRINDGSERRLTMTPVSYTHLTLPTTPYV